MSLSVVKDITERRLDTTQMTADTASISVKTPQMSTKTKTHSPIFPSLIRLVLNRTQYFEFMSMFMFMFMFKKNQSFFKVSSSIRLK